MRALALALLLATVASPALAGEVALTFDDLPTMALSPTTDYAVVTTKDLLAGLKRHRFPAIGFVNEVKLEARDKPERIALLKAWLDAGMDLGNHTYDHPHFTTDAAAEIAEVEKGEVVTRALLAARHRSPHWFRHPYLETGATDEARKTFEAWLGAHGYRVAPVSMENSDWMFAMPYDEAVLKGDAAEAARIQKAYLDFTAQIVPWYIAAAKGVLGREPKFVFLMHATRLNAESIDGLAAILKANDLKAVTLARAMTDPAYVMAEDAVGTNGNQWVSRWAETLKKPMPWASLPKPPADIAAIDNRLEGAVGPPAAPAKPKP
ncbi:polysaccharide deacetylase family protein [Phenylobacterium sp.]|uniref:polysaccharide deacetylase family protein n=1 Tax=Phenylobacterium sp. TaxID=1871053 RepID=UPI002C79FFCA|nr:polysaccharide deacetylase family protein [Phenylobacterium sp.]HLZ76864.1 polysaccharide deacetylase family protein [Phenylobacterium sp.]